MDQSQCLLLYIWPFFKSLLIGTHRNHNSLLFKALTQCKSNNWCPFINRTNGLNGLAPNEAAYCLYCMSTSEKNTIIRINHKQFNVRSFDRWPKVLVRPKTLCGGIRQWSDAYWSIYFMDLNLSGAHPDWHARTAVGGGGGMLYQSIGWPIFIQVPAYLVIKKWDISCKSYLRL